MKVEIVLEPDRTLRKDIKDYEGSTILDECECMSAYKEVTSA